MEVHDLPTPALVIEVDALEANLATMAAAHPGAALRPHVKAHKCTALAARQRAAGHETFTCATPREAVGMAAAGLGADLLLANEVLDPRRLEALSALGDDVSVTVAVDSEATVDVAALAGIRRCVIDVDVGLPRCGCDPADAGRLAELARARGIDVRGVMGYEGHLMVMDDRARQRSGGRGRHDPTAGGPRGSRWGHRLGRRHRHLRPARRDRVTEIQAGSYALMDTSYATLGLPFEQAVFVVGTVISVRPRHAVADVGLKALGMDHGNPSIDGATVWFCSDEHVTFADASGTAPRGRRPGARHAGPRRPDPRDARGGVAGARRRGARSLGHRPAGVGMMWRRIERLPWLAIAVFAAITPTPWIRRANGRIITVLQSLMPWPPLSAAPVAVAALVMRRRRLAAAGTVVAAAGVAVSLPLVRRRAQPPVADEAQPLTIVHANLLHLNRRVDEISAVLRPLAPDLVTFCEFTPVHASKLQASELAQDYPYRLELPARAGSGTALWSRYPVTSRPTTRTKHHTVVADVDAPGGPVRVIVIHTQSPLVHHGHWLHDLEQLAALEVDGPAVMTGDFNAGWWHPEFRDVLGSKWRDAHVTLGHGLSCSWPTDIWHKVFTWHPPFVRLDHALVNDGLVVLDVTDFDVPGSDHRGIMVTVAPARP